MVNNTNDNSYYDVTTGYSPELKELLRIMLITDQKSLVDFRHHLYKTFLERVCSEISEKLERISKRSENYPHSRPVIDHVTDKMKKFICERNEQLESDIRTIPYQLEIAHKLERIDWDDHQIAIFTPVDEVLIYMNYNSKTYIDMLQNWLAKRIEAPEEPFEQLKLLNLYVKGFSQLMRKPDVMLHADFLGLDEVMGQWFEHEYKYLEQEYDLHKKVAEDQPAQQVEKIKWTLSADQIALMIRAADDVRMFAEKSMNAAFKKLVPHFSSLHKDALSPSAVRSKSYNAEDNDKQVVISMLEKMISRIKGY
jgi:hypothetical protein